MEQEIVRRYYAGFISQHSHNQMKHWFEKFSGVEELARNNVILTKQLEKLNSQLKDEQKKIFHSPTLLANSLPPVIRIIDLKNIIDTPERSTVHWNGGDWTVVSKSGNLQNNQKLRVTSELSCSFVQSNIKYVMKKDLDVEFLEYTYDIYGGVNKNFVSRIVLEIELK